MTRYQTSGPAVVSDTVDNETIIVNLDDGAYYDLNRAGAAIWEALQRGLADEEIVADLVERFGAEPASAGQDVAGLLQRLLDERLIVALDGAQPPPSSNGGPVHAVDAGVPYEPPVINQHSDMQELLLLDPIHEVDEAGWPSKA